MRENFDVFNNDLTLSESVDQVQATLNISSSQFDDSIVYNDICDSSVTYSTTSDVESNIVLNESMRPSNEVMVDMPLEGMSLHSNIRFSASNSIANVSSSNTDSSMASTNNNSSNETSLIDNDQTDTCSLNDLGFTCKGFRIGHINIQGLNNKMDQVRFMLSSEENRIQIFGLSETKLQNFHPDNIYEINGYQKPFRRDRQKNQGGGILLYVENGVACKHRPDLEHKQLECIWLEVKHKKSKPFLVGHIYRPPDSGIDWNEAFEDCIENVLKEEKEIYLLGDVNRDLLNRQIKTSWSEYMEPFGLDQLVSEATRVTSTSKTLIDHIYSNCPENVTSIDVPKIGLSDHFPIFFTRKMHVQPKKGKHYTISYRSFKDFDETKFSNDLTDVPWDIIRIFDDTNDILNAWSDLFLEVVDANVPIKQHRVKRKNQPEWITSDLMDAMKTRDRHKSLGNENEYKHWRNKVTTMIRQSKQEKYQTYIESNKDKPGSIYKLFQEVGAGKGKQKQSEISSINCNGNIGIESPSEISNALNDFFVNVASNLKEPIPLSTHDKLEDFCKSKNSENTAFTIPNIEKDKVLKYLLNVNIKKATGTDNIGARILKLAAPYIADDITFICNKSISSSCFPDKWKEAKVSPLHKSGLLEDINNYRPISILPVLSKVLERHVSDSLTAYLNDNELLHRTQSGFRTNHSCETALNFMTDSWLNAIDQGEMIGVVLVDFKKAFDLVDHNILLTKLKLYGIKNETLLWFKSYLSQRQQQVSINNTRSGFKPISCGVPQGSILGPLLFLLFINDLPLFTSNVLTDMYADDTTLYFIHRSLEAIERNLQIALNELNIWCKNNGMVLNTAKTKVMLITTKQKRNGLVNDKIELNCNNDQIQTITSSKILGVFVDNNLCWSEHVKHITKKIASNVWLLSKIKTYLSLEHRVQFYKTYIQPHIDFCNIIWGNASENNKLKVFRMQKRAVRVILDYDVEDTTEAMKSLNILSFCDRLILRKAKFMFKVYHNMTPTYINENFNLRSNLNTSVNLRSMNVGCFIPPKPHTECFKQSMRYSGCLIWNGLPDDVKSSDTQETFHRRCLKSLIDKAS